MEAVPIQPMSALTQDVQAEFAKPFYQTALDLNAR
jgi:hypothetical protein